MAANLRLAATLKERFAASLDFRVEFRMCAEIVQNGVLIR